MCAKSDLFRTASLPLLLILISLGCSVPRQQQDASGESRFAAIEANPGNSPPIKEADGLRRAENLVSDKSRPVQQTNDEKCPFEVSTWVRAETGTNCDTYKAEIAGSSIRCVKECDDGARLAEAIASAQITCAEFCRKKNCPGPRYQPPTNCAVSRCFDSKKCIPDVCPKYNSCYLLQGDRIWNCVCVEG